MSSTKKTSASVAAESLFYSLAFLPISLEREELINHFLNVAVKEFDADLGRVIVRDSQSNFRYHNSDDNHFNHNYADSIITEHILQDTMLNTKGVHSDGMKFYKGHLDKQVIENSSIGSLICAPLFSGRWVIGAFILIRHEEKKAFDSPDLNLLLAYSNIFARELDRYFSGNSLLNLMVPDIKEASATQNGSFSVTTDVKTMVGQSTALTTVFSQISGVLQNNLPVYICGKPGTGRSLLAEILHVKGDKANKEMIIVAEDKTEVQYGSVKPLITFDKFGNSEEFFLDRFFSELEKYGTVIIDGFDAFAEEHAALVQKLFEGISLSSFDLFRIILIGEQKYNNLGKTNVSFIAEGEYLQLIQQNVIEMPSLNDMRDDIPMLIEYFLNKYSKYNKSVKLSNDVLKHFLNYDWVNNIAELERIILYLLSSNISGEIKLSHLPDYHTKEALVSAQVTQKLTLDEAVNEYRRIYIEKMSELTDSKADLANLLGINRTHLYKLLKK